MFKKPGQPVPAAMHALAPAVAFAALMVDAAHKTALGMGFGAVMGVEFVEKAHLSGLLLYFDVF